MSKNNLIWITAIGLGGYLLYKSLNTKAYASAEQVRDAITGGGLPTGNGVIQISTGQPLEAQGTIYADTKALSPDTAPKALTSDAKGYIPQYSVSIKEGGKQSIPTFNVDFSSALAGKSLSGGGTNSGYAMSFTPSTYTTMSSGFYQQAKRLGVLK